MSRERAQNHTEHLSKAEEGRRQVKRACERCRLIKRKCNGASPCGRCRSDNLICGYRKHQNSDRTIYRKGYVQMLERHLVQLTAGVQELHKRLKIGYSPSDQQLNGSQYRKPLTQEILDGLGILDSTDWDDSDDSGSSHKGFKEHFPNSTRFTEPTAAPISQSIFPAAQLACPRSRTMIELRYNNRNDISKIQTDTRNDQTLLMFPSRHNLGLSTLSPAFTETLCQFQQQTNKFDIEQLYSEDKYISEIDMHLTSEIDCPFDWSTFVPK